MTADPKTPPGVPYDERNRLIFRLGGRYGFGKVADKIGVEENDLRAWVFIDEFTMPAEAIGRLLALTPEDLGPRDED